LVAVFGVITSPDPTQLDSTGLNSVVEILNMLRTSRLTTTRLTTTGRLLWSFSRPIRSHPILLNSTQLASRVQLSRVKSDRIDSGAVIVGYINVCDLCWVNLKAKNMCVAYFVKMHVSVNHEHDNVFIKRVQLYVAVSASNHADTCRPAWRV